MTRKNVAIKDVIVLNGTMDEESLAQIAAITGRTVISLTDGQTLESLDEDQMRTAGWVKA